MSDNKPQTMLNTPPWVKTEQPPRSIVAPGNPQQAPEKPQNPSAD